MELFYPINKVSGGARSLRGLLYSCYMIMISLFLPLAGIAQSSITITGPTTVCVGTTEGYSISPTAGINYTWSVSSNGNISGPNVGANANASWIGSGSGSISVQGRNASNVLVQVGSLPVYVTPLPTPNIEWDSRVGCQIVVPEKEPEDPKEGRQKDPQEDIEDGPCVRVCSGSIVKYWITDPTGGPVQWEITGGNVLSSSGSVCVVEWGPMGYGSVKVIEGRPAPLEACEGTAEVCIEIIASPLARFLVIPEPSGVDQKEEIKACKDQVLYFVDDSDPNGGTNIVSWYWDFDDGTYSSAMNPSHSFSNPGTYKVTLTVTNECNCTSTISRIIHVEDTDRPLVIECPSVVCKGAIATYTLSKESLEIIRECYDAGMLSWDVIGGTIIDPLPPKDKFVTILWDNPGPDGYGYVILSTNGCGKCPAPTVIKVPIITPDGKIAGPTVACPKGKQYVYSLPKWPTTIYEWSIITSTGAFLTSTDQANEKVLVTNTPGIVRIVAKYRNTLIGCGGADTIIVRVTDPVYINGPDEVCVKTTHNYSLPGSLTADWELRGPGGYVVTASGVNAQSFFFPIPGKYVLNVNGNFCFEKPLEIYVQEIPQLPNFIDGTDSICVGVPYIFEAGVDLPTSQFEWTISSGYLGGQSGPTATAVFTGSGPYAIHVARRNIKSPNCVSAPISKVVYPIQVVVKVNGNNKPCPNTMENYVATYGSGETYEWSISPQTAGSVASGNGTPNVTVQWNNTSSPVSAYVIVKMRKCATVYYDSLPVTIFAMPVLGITGPDSICNGTLLNLTVTGSGSSGVTWAYPGGTYTGNPLSVVLNANINANSTFTFVATVSNPNGCPGSISVSKNVLVKPKPAVSVSPSGTIAICPPNPINVPLTATLQVGSTPTQTLEWYSGSSMVSSCTTPFPCATYNATAYGSYYVVARGQNGCDDQSKVVNIINQCPVNCVLVPSQSVGISLSSNDNCGEFAYTATFSGTPINKGWNYDPTYLDHVSTVGNTLTLRASMAGNYTITYWADYVSTTGDTCRVYDSKSIVVPLIAKARFGATCNSSGTGYNLTIMDFSNLYPGTTIVGYTYYLNTSAITGMISSSSYTTNVGPGSYTVSIKVRYTYGGGTYECMTPALSVVMPALPVANFAVVDRSPACEGYPISFQNTAYAPGVSYKWEFGDLTSTTIPVNVSRAYNSSGTKSVVLTASNQYGCSVSATKSVLIQPQNVNGSVKLSPSNIVCPGTVVNLSYLSTGGFTTPTGYKWMDDTTNFMNTTYNPISVTSSGYYWAHVTSNIGCYFDTKTEPLVVIDMPKVKIVGDEYFCVTDEIRLDGYAGPGITYQWYMDGMMLSGYTNPSLRYMGASPGVHDFRLRITYVHPVSGTTCTAMSNPFYVTVSTPPVPPSVHYDVIDCDRYLIEMKASHPESGSFTWSNGMFGDLIYVTEGGAYKVWFDNGKGCISSTLVRVQRDPEEYMWVFPKGCYSFCKQQLPKTLVGPIISFRYWAWLWNGNPDLWGFSTVPSSYNINDAGDYNLVLRNDYCERTSDVMNVTVTDCPDCKIQGNAEIVCYKERGGCRYDMYMYVYNGLPYMMNATFTCPYGTIIPTSVPLSPGSNSFILTMIPNPGFMGGPAIITVTGSYYDRERDEVVQCISEIRVHFPERCCIGTSVPVSRGVIGDGSDGAATNLALMPNPAKDKVKIAYTFDDKAQNRVIELYDIAGRKLRSLEVNKVAGSVEWDMSMYDAGLYLIIMRQDGAIKQQAKLSLTK